MHAALGVTSSRRLQITIFVIADERGDMQRRQCVMHAVVSWGPNRCRANRPTDTLVAVAGVPVSVVFLTWQLVRFSLAEPRLRHSFCYLLPHRLGAPLRSVLPFSAA